MITSVQPLPGYQSPGTSPLETIVAENGVRPAGCDLCTWGYSHGQYVLRFVHAACGVHASVPVSSASAPRGK
jgi:hypothetical protein